MLRPLATNPAVSLVLEDPREPLVLETDEGKVAQILRNLVSNALKFTEQGEVRIRVQAAPGGRGAAFFVTDTGIGIAPEDQERVFQEFGQVESHLQGRVKGTGLGLPLSRKLAELLGGSLTLRSATGQGSTFVLTLPARLPDGAEAPGSPEAAPRGPVAGMAPGSQVALVVDDDEAARYRLRRVLEALGLQVREAARAGEGLRQAREGPPDAVFLDLVLPDGSGFALLVALQVDPATPHIPIVVVSSSELTPEEERRLQQPGTAFLPKSAWDTADPQAAVQEALLRAGWGARVVGREPR
jgi:CheY-like chemotaxis protein/anti-sigma regulatory factor (Ser/Thr protein kinase)